MGYLTPETEGIVELIAMLFFYITIGKEHRWKWKVLVFASVMMVMYTFFANLANTYLVRKASNTPSEWEPNEKLLSIYIVRYFFSGLYECCIFIINYLTIKTIIRLPYPNSHLLYGFGITMICLVTFSLSLVIGINKYNEVDFSTSEKVLWSWQSVVLGLFITPLLCFAIHRANRDKLRAMKKSDLSLSLPSSASSTSSLSTKDSRSPFIQFFIDLWRHEEFFLVVINLIYLTFVLSEFGDGSDFYSFVRQLRYFHSQFFVYLATSYAYYSLKSLPDHATYKGTNTTKLIMADLSKKDLTRTAS
eukprot:Awhi_evm1s7660